MTTLSHQEFLLAALRLAERGRGTVSPNPMVGCLIVKDNHIVGRGYHQKAGEPHAEVYALKEAGAEAKGATAYVTLEPCCHYGRTPPCSQTLINAGVKEVYVACLDPNPLVAGKGVAELQAAGIKVVVGLCEAEAQQLNEIFFHYIRHKRPFVIAKWAMSLDGKTIVNGDDSPKISNAESHQHAHVIRSQVDAILIGANTARQDDPQLTVRIEGASPEKTRQPIRIILLGRGQLPLHLKVLNSALPSKVIIVASEQADKRWLTRLATKNIEVITLPEKNAGRISVTDLLDELGARAITSVLVEGGRVTHEQFFAEHAINKIQVYLAPVIIANLATKHKVESVKCTPIGNDFYFET